MNPIGAASRLAGTLAIVLFAAACAPLGDFGREQPPLFDLGGPSNGVNDDLGIPASPLPLTDSERQMRQFAAVLIAPNHDRNSWELVLANLRRSGLSVPHAKVAVTDYGERLMTTPYRSATARYTRLIEDINADTVRIEPFVAAARRVAYMDGKRAQTLPQVSLGDEERARAIGRMEENAQIYRAVTGLMSKRAAGYRYALERLVVATPSPMAVEAERAVATLERRIAGTDAIVARDFERASAGALARRPAADPRGVAVN